MTLISTRMNLCASENPLKLNHAQRTPALFGQIGQTGPNVQPLVVEGFKKGLGIVFYLKITKVAMTLVAMETLGR